MNRGRSDIDTRVEAIDWASIPTNFDGYGWAVLGKLWIADECKAIAALYEEDHIFHDAK